MKKYDHQKIENKWRKVWQKDKIYQTKGKTTEKSKGKFYVLDMFPYPSGDGLHVGHPRGYIGTDIYSRFKKMEGYNVLHPMGWDAFGLPAEQYAIKNKIHPEVAVKKNIKRYKEQLSILGFNYDWTREINTTDPLYYKWTQWTFLQMFKKGLAYESYEPINWCATCQTGLANEDLSDGACERCGTVVEKRPMRQWVLKITKYAERLLEDLEALNWPESIKISQRNWIGKSTGGELTFAVKNSDVKINVFTTRADTLFGATYVVLAPEHSLVEKLSPLINNKDEVKNYIIEVKNKTEIDRTREDREKTGIKLVGVKAINPVNNEELPVFLADYVLAHYGTGAVMAVPAHDERDFAFAKKFGLPIVEVVKGGNIEEGAYVGDGFLINSGKFDGVWSEEARDEIVKYSGGQLTTKYKLQDWVFSRQRYWGEPIPIIHCEKCGAVPVPEKDLPVVLPKVKSYEPSGSGESPLATIGKWVNVKCPKCKGPGKRETNTMPQWAGSSWYYLRYIDPANKKELIGKSKEKYWSPVDLYVGGTEHATRHLIYARFWHKFLFDIGVVNYKEPFRQLKNQGLIIASDGRKMSKRWGNVVNPDEIVKTYGADTLRLYEMFMGPFDQIVAWNTDSIMGPRRFVEKVWRLSSKLDKNYFNLETEKLLHKTIKKVTEDIEAMSFNTAISAMMIFGNELEKEETINADVFKTFLQLLAPFIPHVTEELWAELGNKKSIYLSTWPIYDPNKVKDDKINLVVQVNGKLRANIEVATDLSEDTIKGIVLSNQNVKNTIGDSAIKRFIYIKNKLVNIVV